MLSFNSIKVVSDITYLLFFLSNSSNEVLFFPPADILQ